MNLIACLGKNQEVWWGEAFLRKDRNFHIEKQEQCAVARSQAPQNGSATESVLKDSLGSAQAYTHL